MYNSKKKEQKLIMKKSIRYKNEKDFLSLIEKELYIKKNMNNLKVQRG